MATVNDPPLPPDWLIDALQSGRFDVSADDANGMLDVLTTMDALKDDVFTPTRIEANIIIGDLETDEVSK